METPRSSSILRKRSTTTKPIRCVRFSTAVLRNAKHRDQNPSLNKILSWRFSSAQPQRSKNLGIGRSNLVNLTDPTAKRNANSSLLCGLGTSTALGLQAWISDASDFSWFSTSATKMSPVQMPAGLQHITSEDAWYDLF